MAISTLACGRFQLSLQRPLVMAVLNITPDSFSDGGRFLARDAALRQADALIAAGADLLDIGGESTRPGAAVVSADEECARVLPVLEALQGVGVPLSLDTRKASVMRAGLGVGVDLVNDIAALEDAGALALLAQSRAAVCLMHMQGEPQSMQAAPQYHDVVQEVGDYLAARRDAALAAGIAAERIVLDPGFGFGKLLEHNVALFQNLPQLIARVAQPMLIGVSRKRMLGEITGREVHERTLPSVVAAVLAAQAGAHIIRVHDVRETVDALKLRAVLESRTDQTTQGE